MSLTARSVLWILLFLKGVWCLRIIGLQVPNRVFVGDTIRLTCLYDLEEDDLYSVKWYRNNLEFFRYFPSDYPEKQYSPMHGVLVDMENSSDTFVTLKDVLLTTSGTYRCEVSTEAPSFRTRFAMADLTVEEYAMPAVTAISPSSGMNYGMLSFVVLLGTFIWRHLVFHV